MKKYDGKRVLQVGHGALSRQNIDYLIENGAYVICADKCPADRNEYRKLVNETVQLDIDDNNAVIDFCKKNKIDAVLTNGQEASYEQARIINEGIGNAFWHTEKQWQAFTNKGNFRNLCASYDICTPKTYYIGTYTDIPESVFASLNFPVIVKPVDSAGGDGISVVKKSKKLEKAIYFAGLKSTSKKIIIEEYVVGKEVVFTYVIQNGICKLVASADKYVYKDKNGLTAIPDLYIYPCADHDLYVNSVDDKVVKMIKEQGIKNGTVFFQTIERDKKFHFFEAGLRFEGTKTYLITSYLTGQNSYHLYYDTVLKTKTDYDIMRDDPKLYGNTLSMYAVHVRRERIRRIYGKDKIAQNPKIKQVYYLCYEGKKIGKSPLDPIAGAFCMYEKDMAEIAKGIRFIKRTYKIKNRFFMNMVVNSFNEKKLLK